MPTPRDALLSKAAEVVCELSAGQAEALASEISTAANPKRLRQVAGLAAPSAVKELGDLWVESGAIDGPGLADAIRCAARAVKTASSYEKVELLYTGPDSNALRRNLQGLLEVIRGAHDRLWIVSYVIIDIDEVLRALEERATAGVEVNVLIDHRTKDYARTRQRIASQAASCRMFNWPDEHRKLGSGKFASLHAKVAVADGLQAYVGSANLTGRAMERNLEIGYLITGGTTPVALASHLDGLVASHELVLIEA